MAAMRVRRVLGVVFDMDGTLTVPVLDFALMRSRLGLRVDQDILGTVSQMTPAENIAATRIIKEMEDEAMLQMQIQPGFDELMTYLELHQIPKAILTRNHRGPVDHLLKLTGRTFEATLTRDFVPVKPAPEPLLHICANIFKLDPSSVLMVGDALDDLRCGRRAGAISVLLRNSHNVELSVEADIVIDRLDELIDILEPVKP